MLPIEECIPFPSGRPETARIAPSEQAQDDPAARDPLVGRWINGRLRLVALIARGGMGSVYLAEQAPLGRICAVKLLHPRRACDPRGALERRFWLEASVTSALSHPNIVTVFECGCTADNLRYMAMEYLVGRTLGRAIREAGSFPVPRAVHVATQICRALREAHTAGVVHRDLKPSNVFLVETEHELEVAKVLDFGLVRDLRATPRDELTDANLVLGSPRYMAPEQIRGEKVDARTDIYALGIVLYEMIAGAAPFDGASRTRTLAAHLNDEVPPMLRGRRRAGASRRLEQIVRRCLEKDPERRFPSMADVLAALDAQAGSVRTPWRPSAGDADGARSGFHELPSGELPSSAWRGESVVRRKRAARFGRAVRPFAVALAIAASALLADRVWRPSGVRTARAAVAATSGRAAPPPSSLRESGLADSTIRPADLPLSPESTVAVQVTTQPTDARVTEGDVELCRSTPCAIVYEGADARPDGVHLLTVARDGYRTETKPVRPTDGSVEIALVPVPVRRRIAPPSVPASRDPPWLPSYRLDVPY